MTSRPKRTAARCQGVTFAGNSPAKSRTLSPERHGNDSATAWMPCVAPPVTARSRGFTPSRRAPLSRRRARTARAIATAGAPLAA